jgi:hypothetical protein
MGREARGPLAKLPMLSRMVGAGLLDRHTFEEVSNDNSVTIQAVAVVALAAMAIGFALGPGLTIPIGFVIYWVSWWGVWVFLFYLLGPALLNVSNSDALLGQFGRATGFAQAPAVLIVFYGVIPGPVQTLHLVIFITVALWWLAALTVAVRQVLKLRSGLRAAAAASTFIVPTILIDLFIS